MIKTALTSLVLFGAGVVLASCGGVPGNAVATVDGEPIEKSDFSYYMTVAARSGTGKAAAAHPENDYAKCLAAKRQATPAPAEGQPKVTDAQLKAQCKQEYEQLRTQVVQLL